MATPIKICQTCKRSFNHESDYLQNTSHWRICSDGHLWFECSCHSTLMILKGKFDWYSPAVHMSDEAGRVFNRMSNGKDLPHIPNAVMQVLALLDKKDLEPAEIVSGVKREPFVAEEVLKIASNLRNQRLPSQRPLASLEHAINYIGYDALRDILMSAALKKFSLRTKQFTAEVFWREAYAAAAIAEHICRTKFKDLDADECFHAACLMNAGKLVAALAFPQDVDRVYAATQQPETAAPWRRLEMTQNTTSHVILGEIAASFWGFSTYVKEAIFCHHSLDVLEKKLVKERPLQFYYILMLANQLSHRFLSQLERIDQMLLREAQKSLLISEEFCAAVIEEVGFLKSD